MAWVAFQWNTIEQNAKQFALRTPRRVALPLLPKVKGRAYRLGWKIWGVISKAEAPTDWCAGMVVVPKADGNIYICDPLSENPPFSPKNILSISKIRNTITNIINFTNFTRVLRNSAYFHPL